MKVVLSIAGSDSSGGAGIQADIKTILANKCFAETAITALTAQNTLGVYDIMNVTPKFLEEEIDAVFNDIRPDAVKIGMVSDKDLIKSIAKKLKEHNAKNIVVDPVMVATSGARLLNPDAEEALIKELIPMACLITPNIPEAMVLSGIKIDDAKSMEEAAKIISKLGAKAILVKGGHRINDANDLLYFNG
jgi:hydroxymethylpyrimidine/phosphomethylpyrimidine kinase